MADTKLFNIKGTVKEYQSGTVTLEKELQTVIENCILLTSLVKTRHRRSRYLSKYEKCILHVPLPCMVIRQRTTLKAQ